jgi:hypothetical protein
VIGADEDYNEVCWRRRRSSTIPAVLKIFLSWIHTCLCTHNKFR